MVKSIVVVLIVVACVQWELSLMSQAASVVNQRQRRYILEDNFLGISFDSYAKGSDISVGSGSNGTDGQIRASGLDRANDSGDSFGSGGSGNSMGSGDSFGSGGSRNSMGSSEPGDSEGSSGSGNSIGSDGSGNSIGFGSSNESGKSGGSAGPGNFGGSSGFEETSVSDGLVDDNSIKHRGYPDDLTYNTSNHLFNFNPFGLHPPETTIQGVNGNIKAMGAMMTLNDPKFTQGTVYFNTKQNEIYINGKLIYSDGRKDFKFGTIELTREKVFAFQIQIYGSRIRYIDNLGAIVVVPNEPNTPTFN